MEDQNDIQEEQVEDQEPEKQDPEPEEDDLSAEEEEYFQRLQMLEDFRGQFAKRVEEMVGLIENQRGVLLELGKMAANLPIEWEDETLPPIQEMIGLEASSAEFHYRFARFIRSSEIAVAKVRATVQHMARAYQRENSPYGQVLSKAMEGAVEDMKEEMDLDILGGLEGLSEEEREAEIRKRVAAKIAAKTRPAENGDETNIDDEPVEPSVTEDE